MAKKKTDTFGEPGALAMARFQAGDLLAGILLYRLRYRWRMDKKLIRFGKEWVAMSRSDWAREAGLSEAQMKNRALPILRGCEFVQVRQMKLTPGGPKLLWMHLDEALLPNTHDQCWEAHEMKMNDGAILSGTNGSAPSKISKNGTF